MNLCFNCPLNAVSFGQVSIALLREAFKTETSVLVAPIGDKPNVSAQESHTEFFTWLDKIVKDFGENHDRSNPTFKLWHLNGSMGWLSDNQALMTFYELDDPTDMEVNLGKNNRKLIFSSEYAREVFASKDVESHYVPLGFDAHNFRVIDKEYYDDNRIVFNLSGKFEFRKRHAKILKAWSEKYGNDKKYLLQCSVHNPFFDGRENNEFIADALNHQRYYNISFLPMMEKNSQYNDYLNSGDIIIGMSGGEGWGLPEFQSVALGKHGVILNAHAYKEWATEENAVLVNPSKKIDCVDGKFFKKGDMFNQGQIFDWNEDDFISGCEEAIKRVKDSRVNKKGLELQDKFSYSNTFSSILKILEE